MCKAFACYSFRLSQNDAHSLSFFNFIRSVSLSLSTSAFRTVCVWFTLEVFFFAARLNILRRETFFFLLRVFLDVSPSPLHTLSLCVWWYDDADRFVVTQTNTTMKTKTTERCFRSDDMNWTQCKMFASIRFYYLWETSNVLKVFACIEFDCKTHNSTVYLIETRNECISKCIHFRKLLHLHTPPPMHVNNK